MEEEPRSGSHRSILNDLSNLRIFVAVVEGRSFTEAGRRLRIVPSTVSKHIAALETRIRGQLIIRSTQQLSVTELGRSFYEQCVNILQEVENAENLLGAYQAEPQGLLRVTAATVLATRHLTPILNSFLDRYPKVKLDLALTTVAEDLVADGIDVAIRISNNLDPNLVAVKLAPNIRVFCASPEYLAREGRPASVEDLTRHNCLVMRNVTQSAAWPMKLEDGSFKNIVVSGNFVTNNGDMLRQALLSGRGIGHLARFMVHDHIESGELVELFPESRTIASHIYVVFPKRRNLPLKTRAFVDHLRAEFRHAIPWAEPLPSSSE